MIDPKIIFGRLGNSMFQYAFLYAYAKDHDLDFYFQDEYFFKDHAEAIRTLYSSDIPPQTNKVAIHVRRAGNPINPNEPAYSDNPFYVNLSNTDYYERAIAEFPKGTEFLVFSDDKIWCEDKWGHLANFEIHYGSEIEDLNKMASCKGHIIANSSFSWWGAWLSPYTKKVIAPKDWYADGVQRTICPDDWKLI